MAITIPQSVRQVIIDHARREAPVEACGYLGGRGDTVIEAVRLRNVDDLAEHFSFDPAEQFAAVRGLRAKGLNAIAVYHSHPATPARPSAEDIRLAADPSVHYVIVSLAQEPPQIKSFRIRNGTVETEEIVGQ